MTHGRKIAGASLAAVIALSGVGSILLRPDPTEAIDAVDLTQNAADPDPANRREEDDVRVEVNAEDDPTGDGDDTAGDDGTNGGANTGDGDDTAGDDGTSGGANTGDGDDTAGDDGDDASDTGEGTDD